MKILKLYAKEQDKTLPYNPSSPLMRKIKELYDCDEVLLPADISESDLADLIRKYDVLLTMWESPHIPNELAKAPGNLKYICNITGEIARWIDIDIVESPHITITNWGDAPAFGVAEGAFSLLMSVIKDIPIYVKCAKDGKDFPEGDRHTSLYKRKIGIYGAGVIGRKFIDFLRPFKPIIYVYDPFAKDIPEGCERVDSLEEFFSNSQIVSIHAGLTEQTKGSVTKELLAMLPDGGIVINTARGLIVDYDALKAEIMSGRLRAGLDVVTDMNMPDEDDPVRQCDNVLFTAHHISAASWGIDPEELDFAAENCLDNLKRFSEGKELRFVMTPQRYKLST